MRGWAVLVMVAATLSSGCSASYSSGDGSGSPTTTPADTQYGSDALIPTSTTSTVACGSACPDGKENRTEPEAPPPLAAADAAPSNRSQKQDPSGFRFTLVSDGASTFRTTDRVAFELTFENTSDRTLLHDSNQTMTFALYRQAENGSWQTAWSNLKCSAVLPEGQRPVTGVVEAAPGEKGVFLEHYPSSTENDSDCGVGAGKYVLVGFLDWCPDEAVKTSEHNGARYCDRALVKQLQSAPLRIEFTG